jgi:hypothetical protein
MSAIYKTIEIEFKGESYKIRPTFDFINSLEEGYEINLLRAIQDVATQSLSISKCAKIVTCALSFAGVKVTPQDVLEEYGTFSGQIIKIAADVILACNYNPVSEELAKK